MYISTGDIQTVRSNPFREFRELDESVINNVSLALIVLHTHFTRTSRATNERNPC